MIDANLLRQLGWHEDLIHEVTRVATKIRREMPTVSNTTTPISQLTNVSSDTLFIDSTYPAHSMISGWQEMNPSRPAQQLTKLSKGRAKTVRR